MGGFGLRSLSGHSPAAFISSLAASGFGNLDNVHLQQAVTRFNSQVSPQDAITIEAILASPPPQSSLSKKVDGLAFNLYCPPPLKLIRHVSFQFQPPLQVLGYLLFPPQV